jgi:hypothetical protein
MIRVTVDLLPHGSEEGKRTLTTFDIANDGTGDAERGDYKFRTGPNKEWIEKIVTNYPRQAYPVRKLVYLVLKNFYEPK